MPARRRARAASDRPLTANWSYGTLRHVSARNRTAISDEELARHAQASLRHEEGRKAAAELLGRYQKRIGALCYYYLGDREGARDLAQDVLMRAYQSLSSFRGRSRFSSWIYAIARNRCRSELRRAAPSIADDVDPDDLCSPGVDPVEDLVRRLDEEALLTLIHAQLSKEEQTAIWLRCVEKVPIASLTVLLDLEQASGARGLLQRARRKLRAALGSRPGASGRQSSD
jgi:RNA polymerase sigma-70 factor (ECF subfamily)